MKLWASSLILWTIVAGINLTEPPPPSAPKPTTIHIISEAANIDITTKKVVHLSGSINSSSVRAALYELKSTMAMPGDRVVLITSSGGEVRAGQVLIDALLKEKLRKGSRLVCVAIDEAHSMAFNTLSFCDVRLATANTEMVAHKIATTSLPRDVRGTAKTLRKIARDIDATDQKYRVQNAKAMNLSLKNYDMYADVNNEWTAEQLLAMHYLQGIAVVGVQ